MFKHAQKRESKRIEILAALHGAKRKKKPLEVTSSQFDYNGDPATCEHMSKKQKDELTDQMMAEHKKMFENSGLTGEENG